MTNRFKAARQNTEFTHNDVNSDVKEKIKLYQTKIKALEEKLQCLSNAK